MMNILTADDIVCNCKHYFHVLLIYLFPEFRMQH